MRRGVWLATLLLAVPHAASGSTLVELSVEQLTRASTAVARIRVTSTRVVAADARHLVTIAECEVLEALKGQPGQALRISVPGGALDGLAQEVSGAPSFTPGEEAVVFLAHPRGGTWLVTGLEQGKWAVSGSVAAPTRNSDRVDAAGRPVVRPVSVALPLEALKSRVRAEATR